MQHFELSESDRRILLGLAFNTLCRLFNKDESFAINSKEISTVLKQKTGAFVSIYNHKTLRACIGNFTSEKPLYVNISDLARAAALNDYRFDPISADEINDLSLELSILSPLERITSIEQIEIGKHGIYIRKGQQSGTFLPQVAQKTAWTREEFVGFCSKNKAGLGYNGWRDAELFRYEVLIVK
ncbi:AmmeMemoRadiSam system protein A [Roseimarinus sediminis]|uniref:AmmeMemoRadiSam system protein A n=1 Tax=Roseimarinus sediminis TaxID=1610899 RepID=UPI003D1A9E69